MSRGIIYPFFTALVLVLLIFGGIIFWQIRPQPQLALVNDQPEVHIPVVDNNNDQPVTADHNIYYLGYGSNMNSVTMGNRCGVANFTDLGWVSLPGYQFYFFGRGAANIKPNSIHQVEGVLYLINQQCFDSLDRAEGYPTLYQRQQVVVDYLSEQVNPWLYIVLEDNTTALPSNTYYQTVLIGAQEHNLPLDYIDYIKTMAGKLKSS